MFLLAEQILCSLHLDEFLEHELTVLHSYTNEVSPQDFDGTKLRVDVEQSVVYMNPTIEEINSFSFREASKDIELLQPKNIHVSNDLNLSSNDMFNESCISPKTKIGKDVNRTKDDTAEIDLSDEFQLKLDRCVTINDSTDYEDTGNRKRKRKSDEKNILIHCNELTSFNSSSSSECYTSVSKKKSDFCLDSCFSDGDNYISVFDERYQENHGDSNKLNGSLSCNKRKRKNSKMNSDDSSQSKSNVDDNEDLSLLCKAQKINGLSDKNCEWRLKNISPRVNLNGSFKSSDDLGKSKFDKETPRKLNESTCKKLSGFAFKKPEKNSSPSQSKSTFGFSRTLEKGNGYSLLNSDHVITESNMNESNNVSTLLDIARKIPMNIDQSPVISDEVSTSSFRNCEISLSESSTISKCEQNKMKALSPNSLLLNEISQKSQRNIFSLNSDPCLNNADEFHVNFFSELGEQKSPINKLIAGQNSQSKCENRSSSQSSIKSDTSGIFDCSTPTGHKNISTFQDSPLKSQSVFSLPGTLSDGDLDFYEL